MAEWNYPQFLGTLTNRTGSGAILHTRPYRWRCMRKRISWFSRIQSSCRIRKDKVLVRRFRCLLARNSRFKGNVSCDATRSGSSVRKCRCKPNQLPWVAVVFCVQCIWFWFWIIPCAIRCRNPNDPPSPRALLKPNTVTSVGSSLHPNPNTWSRWRFFAAFPMPVLRWGHWGLCPPWRARSGRGSKRRIVSAPFARKDFRIFPMKRPLFVGCRKVAWSIWNGCFLIYGIRARIVSILTSMLQHKVWGFIFAIACSLCNRRIFITFGFHISSIAKSFKSQTWFSVRNSAKLSEIL